MDRTARQTSTRNCRTVWTVTTKPYHGAHFATFPPDLIEPCILAGCPAQACLECGAPWERVVERSPRPSGRSDETVYTGKAYSSPQSAVWGDSRNLGGDGRLSTTTGWRPTCECGHDNTVPGTVLDPFGGAGTTALVAATHGREYVLIELNPEYAEMARERVRIVEPVLL